MKELQERFKAAIGYDEFLQAIAQTNEDYLTMMGGAGGKPPVNAIGSEAEAFEAAWERLTSCMPNEVIEEYCELAERHKQDLTEFLEIVHKGLSVVPEELI
tara:strand:- start:4035 stop:4337 length:303 start_codon:yes stop_codon:yes gene_type:complete